MRKALIELDMGVFLAWKTVAGVGMNIGETWVRCEKALVPYLSNLKVVSGLLMATSDCVDTWEPLGVFCFVGFGILGDDVELNIARLITAAKLASCFSFGNRVFQDFRNAV